MNRKLGVGAAAVLLVVIAAVWFAFHKKSNQSAAAPLRIGLTTWIGDGVYHVARAQGFFDREGVAVELVSVPDTGAGKQLLLSGKIDALYLTPETAVVVADAGGKIKIVAATDLSSGADGIIATANIKTIEDLKGKKVAFEVGSPSHFLLSYLLDRHGLTTDDMTVVNNTAADAGAAFVAGGVDAAVTWEPWLSQAGQRPGGHLLASSREAEVIFDMPIFQESVVRERTEEVKALLRAVFAAQEYIAAHPDEAAAIIAAVFKITPVEAASQMRGVRWLSYGESRERLAAGEFSVTGALQAAADLWLRLGLVKNKINAEQLVDTTLLPNLYQ